MNASLTGFPIPPGALRLDGYTSQGSQDAYLTEILRLNDGQPSHFAHPERTIRITIRSDFYRHQCHAYVELFAGNGWNRLADIHPCAMQTPVSAHHLKPELFRDDRDELLRLATAILGA